MRLNLILIGPIPKWIVCLNNGHVRYMDFYGASGPKNRMLQTAECSSEKESDALDLFCADVQKRHPRLTVYTHFSKLCG